MGIHKTKPSSHSERQDSKSHKPDKPTSRSTKCPATPSLSFLFVVNEIHIDPHSPPNVDQWGTVMPPFDPGSYAGETVGTVFRYRDGEVEAARGYYWERDNSSVDPDTRLRCAGGIYLRSGSNPNHPNRNSGGGADEQPWELSKYAQFTVFHCWRPLPCVYMEEDPLCALISPYPFHLGPGYSSGGGGAQFASTGRRRAYGEGRPLTLMSFEDPDITGITHVAAGGTSPVVAGRRPSWMPSLVPEMFRNTDRYAPSSRGLGGLLPVVIAQMALTQPRGQTDRPFMSRWWHRGYWRRPDLESTVSHPMDIRAVMVHVALDDIENREGSTRESLENFEAGAVVRES
ncbi:hypothetical protein F5Y07DRAFT_413198 [Xylaria sp. FL0933]|nr:hypothetical protein F5Y07DRAFT_413198 [Xylaria sp. FL0933]